MDVFVRKAGAILDHVHLQDADGYADGHWKIGQGTIYWHAVFRARSELDGRPRPLLELANVDDIPASMNCLQAQRLAV